MNFEELYKNMRTIRILSSWGSKQEVEGCIKYLNNELNELLDAIKLNDRYNIQEELGDVIMMIAFLEVLMEENNIDYNLSIEMAQKKLSYRYPELLGLEPCQLTIPGFFEEENIYQQQKEYEKKLEFCFCNNNNCKMYAIPFSEFLTINKNYLFCKMCNHKTLLKDGYLFSNIKQDKDLVIKILLDCVNKKDILNVAKQYDTEHKKIIKLLNKISEKMTFTARILNIRYGVEEKDVVEYLQDFRIEK